MRPKRKLFVKLFTYYVIISILLIIAVALYSAHTLKNLFDERSKTELNFEAQVLTELIRDKIGKVDQKELDLICKKYGNMMLSRFTLILPDGRVIGDTEEDPSKMENHSDRPEIISALAGKATVLERFSPTLKQNLIYWAAPVESDGKVIAVARASVPVSSISKIIGVKYQQMFLGVLIAGLIAVISTIIVSKLISKPVENLKIGAIQFAKGNLSYRVSIPDSDEMGTLADSLNKMAQDLETRIRTITEQKNELEAILGSMVESVLVLDQDEKILRCNQAAGFLFGVDPENIKGKTIQEGIRNTQIQRFLKKILESERPIEEEIALLEPSEKVLNASGTKLEDGNASCIGALIVLNDITNLKKLETMRKDFVSNVSHELKTPITSIKGFVETLKDGAIDDKESARKFLEIIATHSDRLNAIIEDLLSLSRIEQSEGSEKLKLENTKIKDLLNSAITACSSHAKEKDMKIEVTCDKALSANINSPFLEHAITNLIDNAVKYSDPGKTIKLEAGQKGGEVLIHVVDQGFGISKEHLPRIFERFYRVDKARSRKLGGTGLGLAIAKHIVQAHGGKIGVESTFGKGSTFTISIPLA
jgi:two-component system, OmpR family, phosphate regulon sensor histidine kinase PhoR